jgi:hypothetical protein
MLSTISLVVLPVVLIIIILWLRHRRRWYYWRKGNEVGTFSAYHLGQLYRTGQISSDTPVRQECDEEWYTGVVVEDPPRRIRRGLDFAILGALFGFAIGYWIFGEVHGRHLNIGDIFSSPSDEELAVRFGFEVAANVPGANVLAEPIARLWDKVDAARMRILLTTLVFGVLAAAAGGATAKGVFTIRKEGEVVFKRRAGTKRSASED